jgi:cytochrome c556
MSTFKRDWRATLVTITTTAIIASLSAVALAATPAETIKTRQEGMKAMGGAMKTINDQLKTDAPDAAAIKAAGPKVKKVVDNISIWFPKGTGPEAGVETAAKPEIWADPADFADKIKAFQTEAAKLIALTDAGDIAGVKEEVRPLGKACGACHEKYRVKKET